MLTADNPRVEIRFTGTRALSDPLPDGVSEVRYPTDAVSTLVLGRQSSPDGEPVPITGTLRFRYYSESIPEDHVVSVLDPRQVGVLMLKHYGDTNAGKNQKFNIAGMTLGEVCNFLENPDLRDGLTQYDGGAELLRLIEEHYGEREVIMPLMLMQARRRHLLVDGDIQPIGPARVTFDQDTSWWPVVERRPGDVLAAHSGFVLPQNILEIKRAQPLDPTSAATQQFLAELFGGAHDYIPQGRLKRKIGRLVVDSRGTPTLINPEWTQQATDQSKPSEVIRTVKERECKIDTATDPRDAIRSIPPRPKADMWVDPGFPRTIDFRFHTFRGPNGEFVVAEKINYNASGEVMGVGFQYKQTLEKESMGSVLVRDEKMAPTINKLWHNVGYEQAPGELVEITQMARRHRIHRRVVCEKTGNVFLILADFCVAESGDRPPLPQVEIEYRGKYGFAREASEPDEASIAADFVQVEQLVRESLLTNGVTVTDGRTTKQAWLTSKTP